MAYSEKDLIEDNRFGNRIRFAKGQDVNLTSFQSLLQDEADENGIPVAFRDDILKTGGFFNKQVEDVVVVYNPEHEKDYFNFLVRITHQGKYAFLDVFVVGRSRNISTLSGLSDFVGDGSDIVSGLVGGLVNKVTGTTAKVQTEQNYYTILSDCLDSITN